MNQVNAGLVVTGIIDGTTIVYEVAVVEADGSPTSLTQYYDESKCVPDWEDIYTNGTTAQKSTLPRIIIKAYDTSTGQDITNTVNITNVYYNGNLIGFTSNISNNTGGVPGLLKKDIFSYNGSNIPCIMMIGNPADSLLNPDDDRITFDGTVVSGGGQVSFSGIGKDVAIRPVQSANAGFSVELLVPTNIPKFIMTNNNNEVVSTQRIARLYYNGIPVNVSNMTGYQFKFYDITGPSEVLLASGNGISFSTTNVSGDTIAVGAAAVDCLMTIRCKILDANNNELASGTSAIYDLSDPYSVKWIVADSSSGTNGVEYTGVEPRVSMRSGQTKYFIPKLLTEKGDTFPQGSAAANVTWTFNADDANTGASITGLSGVPSSSGQTYCSLAYSDVVQTDASGNKTLRPIKIHAQSSTF